MNLVLIHPVGRIPAVNWDSLGNNIETVYFVDPQYYRFRKNYLTEYKEDAEVYARLNANPRFVFIEEFVVDWPDRPKHNCIYVAFDLPDAYAIMSYLRIFNFDDVQYIAITPEEFDIKDITSSKQRYYNLYAGQRGNVDTTVRKYMNQLAQIVSAYIERGFHQSEIIEEPVREPGSRTSANAVEPIYGWMMNVETIPLRGIIDYYGVHSVYPDRAGDDQTELMESGLYRKLLTELLTAVVANFVVNNQIRPSVDKNATPQQWLEIASDILTVIPRRIRA